MPCSIRLAGLGCVLLPRYSASRARDSPLQLECMHMRLKVIGTRWLVARNMALLRIEQTFTALRALYCSAVLMQVLRVA